jgi:hypothetical protein
MGGTMHWFASGMRHVENTFARDKRPIPRREPAES